MGLENYNNIIIIGADRNGTTAFQYHIKRIYINQDFHHLWLGECFSQDVEKNQPPEWYDDVNYKPADVIKTINKGTGKGVYLKIQITWPNFNESYFDIDAERRIFFHRNLFDSTLSRCYAQLSGHWFTFEGEHPTQNVIHIDPDYFKLRLEYRLERYMMYMDKIKIWGNEFYRYENINLTPTNNLVKNKDRHTLVSNITELQELYKTYKEIDFIENEIQCLI